VVPEALAASQIAESIVASAGELCESVEVASEYRGGSVPAGQRSLTFRVTYRDPLARKNSDDARTLTDKEVDEVQSRILEAAKSHLGAVLR